VEVGEQHLALAQLLALARLGLLDLDDHLGALEDFRRLGDDRCPGHLVVVIGDADAGPGAGLDQRVMAVGHHLAHVGGRQPHPVFLHLDFLGHADQHMDTPVGKAGRDGHP
jgi:hypothetical protein